MFRSFLSFAVLAVAIAFSSTANSGSDWTVSRSSGEVWIASKGVARVSLGREADLAGGGVITTGKSGRVLLVRGEQSINIGPNSEIGIPDDNETSAFTTILQRSGIVEFEVDKRQVKHFSVETPYLAAVVKGTHFVVTANGTSGAVKVSRGRVEVTDLRTGQHVDVTPGQKATVGKNGGLAISGQGEHDTIEKGAPRKSVVGSGLASLSAGSGGVSAKALGENGVSLTANSTGVNASLGGTNGVNAGLGGGGVGVSVGGSGGVSVGIGGSGGVSVGVGGGSISVGGLVNSLGL